MKQYKDQGMWPEALRVCKEYVAQGRQLEESGEYMRAVECYLKIDSQTTRDVNILAAAWTKAAEIAIKFLDADKASDVASIAGPKLVEINQYNAAAQLYLCCEVIKEAVDVLMFVSNWCGLGGNAPNYSFK